MSNKDTIIKRVFRIQVNYDLSIEKAIEAGKYIWVEDDINNKYFPPKNSGSAIIEMCLVCFEKDMFSDGIIEEMDRVGLRPAELPEFLAFWAQCSDEQKNYPIVALGSVCHGPGSVRGVPCLAGDVIGYSLGIHYLGGKWIAGCRFAAVSK